MHWSIKTKFVAYFLAAFLGVLAPILAADCTGAPHTIPDYTALRSILNSNQNDLAEVTDSFIAGCFQKQITDPNGHGDDGGLVLAASGGGFWVRLFDHSPTDPIKLDWFESVTEGADISTVLNRLYSDYRLDKTLYLQYPSKVSTIAQENMDWRDLDTVHLLEPSSPLRINQIAQVSADPSNDNYRLYQFENITEVIIGGPNLHLTYWGIHTGVLGGIPVRSDQHPGGQGMIDFKQNSADGTRAHLRFNTRHAKIKGISFMGGNGVSLTRNKIAEVIVAGDHWNSSVEILSGVGHIHYENVVISDPYGVNQGFDGNPYPDNSNGAPYDLKEKSRALRIQHTHRASGKATIQFGGARWFMAVVENLGNGPNSPLEIVSKDFAVVGPRPHPDDPPMCNPNNPIVCQPAGTHIKVRDQGHMGKMDSIGDHGPGKKYIRFTEGNHEYGNHAKSHVVFEASTESQSTNYKNAYIVAEIVNSRKGVTSAVLGSPATTQRPSPDYSRYITFKGLPGSINQSKLTLRDIGHSVDGGVWTDIIVQEGSFYTDSSVSYPTKDTSLRNIEMKGELSVGSGASNTTLSNVTFSGSPRQLMTVILGSDVSISNMSVPTGSSIGGAGSLHLNGNEVAIPYYFSSKGFGSTSDNTIHQGEQCADGNKTNNDGCNAYGIQEGFGNALAHWPMDGAGFSLTDASGESHSAKVPNGIDLSQGRHGQAMSFDGSNDYAVVSMKKENLTPSHITVGAWFKPDAASLLKTQGLVTSYHSTGYWHYELKLIGGEISWGIGNFNVPFRLINSDALRSGLGSIEADKWHHVVGTYDGQAVRLYLNGTEVASKSESRELGTPQKLPTCIGNRSIKCDGRSAEMFDGLMDDVVFFDRALSGSEVQSLYENQFSRTVNYEFSGNPSNQIPIVALTAPPANTIYTKPISLNLAAEASDPDGSISSVEFFQGQTSLGVDSSEPYNFLWESIPVGTYALSAVARDNEGGQATSGSVLITVADSTNDQNNQHIFKNVVAPHKGESLIVTCENQLAFYTPNGQLIKTVDCQDQIGVWNGRNNEGQIPASGLILIKEKDAPLRRAVIVK